MNTRIKYMCRLIESIRIYQGAPEALEYHQARFDAARRELFGLCPGFRIFDLISNQIPGPGLYKCRILYGREVTEISFLPYTPRFIDKIVIYEAGDFRHPLKYEDRSFFDQLRLRFPQAGEFILLRNGEITDSCFSNLAFKSGDQWVTPLKPLLKGTRRQRLLDAGRISESRLMKEDLSGFREVSFINAMNDLGEVVVPLAVEFLELY